MKISALIAASKASATLPQALASVRVQTHAVAEIVIVDYGPADPTPEIVRTFAGSAHRPVHYEKLAEPSIAAARNRLLELATNETVAFLEPDDIWLPRHLAAAVEKLSGPAEVVVSNIRLVDRKSGRPLSEVAPPAQLATNPIRALFTRDAILTPSCAVFRISVLKRAGNFDPHFRIGAVRDFWFRCAVAGAKFQLTERATCQCLKGGEHDPGRALLLAEHTVMFFDKHRDIAAVPAALRRRLLAGSLVTHGRLLRTSDPERAARCFWRAWSLQPVQVQTLGEFALTEWHAKPTREKSATPHPPDQPRENPPNKIS